MNIGQTHDMRRLFQALRRVYHQAARIDRRVKIVQNPTRTFDPNLVKSIVDGEPNETVVSLNFTGYYGGLGIFPDYFTDEIIHHRDRANGLKDFTDIFNHRSLETMFLIWRRYQALLENVLTSDEARNQEFDHFLRSLGGIPEDNNQKLYLRCLSRRHLALFLHKPKTVLGLKYMLSGYFSDNTFSIEEHVPRFLPIPENQRAVLPSKDRGGPPLVIGSQGTFLVGARIRDINGKICIVIHGLDYATYERFLPGGDLNQQLQELFSAYTEDMWHCALKLELRAEEVPAISLGADRRLGSNCWLLSGPAPRDVVTSLGGLCA